MNGDSSDLIESLSGKAVVIYGNGRAGKQLYQILKNNHIYVKFFFDKNTFEGKMYDNIPVIPPKQLEEKFTKAEKEEITIIIALAGTKNDYAQIENLLTESGFKSILRYFPVRIFENYSASDKNVQQKITKVKEFFSDRESAVIYNKYISAFM
ncbi:hypothetical protein [Syntrophobotulus glycolicus]|uniref:hypothetical protein n=1 Tax=Syntrophobotulus glycolicus TaxID=51197 RepID=UPI00059DF709|nr:hypothetical protein [Syntrophobotulus glycolicus]